jgi:hypothetical protein
MMAIWAATVLHRGAPPSKKPEVQETLIFEGLLRCPKTMAEREGLSSTGLSDARNPINKGLSATGENVVYHRCVPLYGASAKPGAPVA